VLLSVRLSFPAAEHIGIDPQIAGGFANAIAIFGDQANGFSREFITIVMPFLAQRRTPPPSILSPLSRCPFSLNHNKSHMPQKGLNF
jgi:hypothetical protein